MSNTNQFKTLATLFDQQLALGQQLLELLQQEREALDQRNSEQVRKLTEQKNDLIPRLTTLGAQQNELLQQNTLATDSTGLTQFINRAPQAVKDHLLKHQHQLSQLLGQCKDINTSNGIIIAASRQSAETALAILRGQVGGNHAVYGASGEQLSYDKANPLGKA